MHIRGDHAELVVGGRLDVRSAADARTVLHSAVDDGVGDLVLDLSELDSWDATGLGVIMGAHRRGGRGGRRRVLRGVPPPAPDPGDRGRHRGGDTASRVTRRAGVNRETGETRTEAVESCDAHNPHETVTSRTARYPGLS
jgi:anti-anti-sigma factor